MGVMDLLQGGRFMPPNPTARPATIDPPMNLAPIQQPQRTSFLNAMAPAARGGGIMDMLRRPGVSEALLQMSSNLAPSFTPRSMFDGVGEVVTRARNRDEERQETLRERRQEQATRQAQEQAAHQTRQLLTERGFDPQVVDIAYNARSGGDDTMWNDIRRHLYETGSGEGYTLGRHEIRFDAQNNIVARGSALENGVTGQAGEAARQQSVHQNFLFEEMDRALHDLMGDGSLAGFWGGVLDFIPGSPQHDFRERLGTIQANVGFAELQRMRDASPTGGALGQITERELARLEAVRGSVLNSQSAQQLTQNMIRMRDTMWEIVHGEMHPNQGRMSRPQVAASGWSRPDDGSTVGDLQAGPDGVVDATGWGR